MSQSECWFTHYCLNTANIYSADINITNPNISRSYFTDGKNINAIYPGNLLTIEFSDNQPVTGKVCALIYSYDSNGIISYNKFGVIDNVTVLPNSNNNLTFTDSMLSYNPPESQLSGIILNIPPHNNWFTSCLWISVSPRLGWYYSANNWFYCTENGNFNFNIPSNLLVNYFPVFTISYSDSTSNGGNIRMNYILPKSGATNLNINVPSYPQISSPPALSYVDSNTIFSYNENYGPHIYHILISDSLKSYNIYTTENNINLRNLWKFGFGKFTANSKISFTVESFGNYNTVDDYVNPDFPNLGTYTAVSRVLNYYIRF